MKLHIGVDSKTGLAHSAVVTAANVHDKHPLPQLLHGQEEQFYGDCAYASQTEQIRSKAPKAKDLSNQLVRKGAIRGYLHLGLPQYATAAMGRIRPAISLTPSPDTGRSRHSGAVRPVSEAGAARACPVAGPTASCGGLLINGKPHC